MPEPPVPDPLPRPPAPGRVASGRPAAGGGRRGVPGPAADDDLARAGGGAGAAERDGPDRGAAPAGEGDQDGGLRPAAYPAHWEADVLAADGGILHLRPIRPADAERIVALHSRLSDRTRYLRYFGAYPRIPDRDLQRFVNVDFVARVALIAELGGGIVAVGRYDRIGAGPDAEVAFVVEDAHQGRGVGSVLLEHLA